MHKKMPGYLAAAFAVAILALYGFLGRLEAANPAFALPLSYDGQERIPAETVHLLKTVSYRPENLLKVTARDVRALLSEPELVRAELPTTVWQYRTDTCVLDIYFQAQSADDPAAPVVHYEMRGREKQTQHARANCIKSLIHQRSGLRMVDVTAIYKTGP